MLVQTTLFRNNQSQAVRLPKAVALSEHIKQVSIIAMGKTRIITPVEQTWDDWFDNKQVSDDFMLSRDQGIDQEREAL